MDTTSVQSLFLGAMSPNQFIVFFGLAMIGLVLSTLLELIAARNTIKSSGGFSPVTWLIDNWMRAIVSILSITLGVLFYQDIFNEPLDKKAALSLSFITDKIIEALKLKAKK